ncbi:MAG: RNA polymerase sigma-70 factor ECF subfamily [Puniceicoccaceae bacterium 5H]|nr:MAG: RNA polymerase sigma-70 factor ECF subfamily [Puniceicoccaceae bacterium 5H]
MPKTLQFKALCHLYSDDVYRYARHLLGSAADAEDAAQEVLLKLWHHGAAVNPFKARSWLMQTTRNHCLDQLRRRQRHHHEPLPESDFDHDNARAPEPDPLESTELADLRNELDRALQQLPETQRSIFVLIEINGLRYREVATTLDLPLNTVKVYLRRAREALQGHLSRHRPSPSNPSNHESASEKAHA